MTERVWQLRAMSVAELLDETVRLYRHNFLTFVGIVALLQVPMSVLTAALTAYSGQSRGVAALPAILDYLVINNLVTAALAWAISNRYLGEPVSIGGAYRAVLSRFWSLLGALMLLTLINGGLIAVPTVLAMLIPCLGIAVLVAAIAAAFWIDIRLLFITQAVVLEGRSARDGLSRSWDLVAGYGWRVFGVFLLLLLFSLMIVSGPEYAVTFGLRALDAPPGVQTIVSSVVSAVLSILYLPIRLASATLLYYDLRIRKEGLDLEMQAKVLAEIGL